MATVLRFDASQVEKLAVDLTAIPRTSAPKLTRAIEKSVDDLRDQWRANARATATPHGRLYPRTITSQRIASAVWEVGPEAALPQGGMGRGFEYGSVNQPPHLDGNRAADAVEPTFASRVAAALDNLL